MASNTDLATLSASGFLRQSLTNTLISTSTAVGVVRDPFIVPLVDQQSATEAIYRVLLGAGAMPRDVTDEAVVMSLLNVLNETKVEPMTFGMIKAMYR